MVERGGDQPHNVIAWPEYRGVITYFMKELSILGKRLPGTHL